MQSELGQKILDQARNSLILHMRYLNLALGALRYQPEEGNGYVGCDGERIYYSTGHLIDLYEISPVMVNRLIYHMLMHCLFRHIWKREDRDHRLWNLACDITAEHLTDEAGSPALRMAVPPYRSQIYGEIRQEIPVMTPEKIYGWLAVRHLREAELNRLEAEFLVDDHSFWYREEKSPRQQQVSRSWKDLASRTQTSMETVARGQDSSRNSMHTSLEFENRERYDYREFLRRFAVFREEVGIDADSFDTTFYTLGLQMYGNMPLIEPLEQREVKRIQDFVVAVDTSLSCPEELVRKFLEETCQILLSTENFFHRVRIHIIQCDSRIQSIDEIRDREDLEHYLEELEIRGRGGTDFRPVFAHVDQMKERGLFADLKGMIYFTDGMGTYPAKPPRYDAAFVFLDEAGEKVEVPPWAMKLYISPED